MNKPPFENKPALGGLDYVKKPVEPTKPLKPPYENKSALGGPVLVKDEAWNPDEPWGKPFEPRNDVDLWVEPEVQLHPADEKKTSHGKNLKPWEGRKTVTESIITVVLGVVALGLPLLGALALGGKLKPSFEQSASSHAASNNDFARGYQAEERLRNSLRDPDSLQVISKTVGSDGSVRIHYRAKNGFGGYTDDLYYEK